MDSPVPTAPALSAFFASQIVSNSKGLFSASSYVRDLYGVSDVHHIFPKAYLQKVGGLDNKSIYNQVANYTFLDTPVNIQIGEKSPNVYFKTAYESAINNQTVYGVPMTKEELDKNLEDNCIPLDIVNWDYNDYIEKFLPERRKLMAQRIKEYYNKL